MVKPHKVKSGIDKRKILDWLSKEYDMMMWAGLKWLRIVVQWWVLVNMVREPLSSIKAKNFLSGRDIQLFKEDPAPGSQSCFSPASPVPLQPTIASSIISLLK
jgi:hypothetical protein